MIAPSAPSLTDDTAPHRVRTRSMRAVEMGITCAIHALAVTVAAFAFSWQSPGVDGPRNRAAPLTFPLHQPDQRRHRPKAGSAMPAPLPAAVPTQAITPPARQPTQSTGRTEDSAISADPGGHASDPAQEVLAYRHAIMARIEAQRFYPDRALRKGWQGAGAILFRIERSGRLLEANVMAGTGRAALDAAALGMVRRAAPYPAIPDSMPDEMSITLPIEFLIEPPRAMATLP